MKKLFIITTLLVFSKINAQTFECFNYMKDSTMYKNNAKTYEQLDLNTDKTFYWFNGQNNTSITGKYTIKTNTLILNTDNGQIFNFTIKYLDKNLFSLKAGTTTKYFIKRDINMR